MIKFRSSAKLVASIITLMTLPHHLFGNDFFNTNTLICQPDEKSFGVLHAILGEAHGKYRLASLTEKTKKELLLSKQSLIVTHDEWRSVSKVETTIDGIPIYKIETFVCKSECFGYNLYLNQEQELVRKKMKDLFIKDDSIAREDIPKEIDSRLSKNGKRSVISCLMGG